jgi:hypothetical protein
MSWCCSGMHIFMCVYIYVCIYIEDHLSLTRCSGVYVYIYIYIYTHVYMHMYANIRSKTFLACQGECQHATLRFCQLVNIHILKHTYQHTHTNTQHQQDTIQKEPRHTYPYNTYINKHNRPSTVTLAPHTDSQTQAETYIYIYIYTHTHTYIHILNIHSHITHSHTHSHTTGPAQAQTTQ